SIVRRDEPLSSAPDDSQLRIEMQMAKPTGGGQKGQPVRDYQQGNPQIRTPGQHRAGPTCGTSALSCPTETGALMAASCGETCTKPHSAHSPSMSGRAHKGAKPIPGTAFGFGSFRGVV